MFINPKTAYDTGLVQGLSDPTKQIQPNAIDFTLDTLLSLDQSSVMISETVKSFRTQEKMLPDAMGRWELQAGKVYDGTSTVYVEVPEGAAAILFTRSTFARNGVFIVSGLYDSGYKGHIGFTIYTIGGPITIERGTRIGQIAFVSAASAGMYAGGYNAGLGQHWTSTVQPQVLN